MFLSGRNFNVLHRTVCAQISPQKMLHPGSRFIQLLHQSTRQPQFIRNNIATASLLLHTHCHAKTKQPETTCWPNKVAATKVHSASSRYAKIADSARLPLHPAFVLQHTSLKRKNSEYRLDTVILCKDQMLCANCYDGKLKLTFSSPHCYMLDIINIVMFYIPYLCSQTHAC